LSDIVSSVSPPGVVSPLVHVDMLPRHVVLPSHGTKTSSPPALYLSATLCRPITSPLKLKWNH
jgi:hypothetical protein